jgi:hypothetical protein
MSKKMDRAALKQSLHDKMLALEEAELETAMAHYQSFMADTKMDGSEAHTIDDFADARESADLAAAFDHPVQNHQHKIAAIEATDFSETDTVAPGAVVRLGGRNFVVCVATSKFDIDGLSYMGISVLSPIYQAMDGLKAGETFEHNGREFTIDDVI